MKTIIVIPTYNEAENIKDIIEAIFLLNIENLEIIVVDDNSPDKTGEIVEELSLKHAIHLIKRSGKLGIGSAYIEGFKKALSINAQYIFEMDADFSHDPKDIPKMLKAAKFYDLIIGSRRVKGGKIIGWGWIRKGMSKGAMWFSRSILQLKTQDVTSGFRCYSRKILETINLESIKSNGYAFQEEMIYRTEQAGFSIKEIPVTFVDRQEGKSKLGKKDIIEFFLRMLKLRLNKK